jgi:NADP-dependent 3-hydroxy acid dehydrogenase YdfG
MGKRRVKGAAVMREVDEQIILIAGATDGLGRRVAGGFTEAYI